MQRKILSRLFFSAKVLLIVSMAEAQNDPTDTSGVNLVPFRKGNWELQTRKYIWGNMMDEKSDSADLGSFSRFNVNLETHYYWNSHFATGIELNYRGNTRKNGAEIKSHDFSVLGHLTYSMNMKDNWGIYLRGGAGIGSGKTEITSGTSPQEIKSDVFIYKFEIGTPIYLNQQFYFLPHISYKNISTDYDDLEQKESRIRIGVGLVSYLNCGEDIWHDNQPNLYERRYASGVSYIGVHGMSDYSFGKNNETSFGGQTAKLDENRFNLKFDYVYYVIPNFGVGADLGFRNMVTKGDNPDYKSSSNDLSFGVKGVYNLGTENWLNDMFLTAGAGLGSEKTEVTISGNNSTQKDNFTFYNAAVGYNFFMSRSSMFTLTVGYEHTTLKSGGVSIKESGLTYELGFRTALGIKPKLNF